MSLFDRFQDLVHEGPRWARPQVVLSALLIVALLAQAGTVAWPPLRDKLWHDDAPPSASGPVFTLQPGLSVASIIAGHLFGVPEPEAGPAEKTALPLELMGTFAAADPTSGMAFLREGPVGPQHFYRVGETLPGGGVLREVYRTRILFAREGRLEELTFPQHPLRVGAQPSMSALPSMVYVDSSSGNAAEALSGNQLPDDSPNGVARVETEQPSVIRRR